MANYIFETMTSEDAAGFTSSDTLSFATPTLTPARVIVFNLDDTPDITTLTAGEKSLIFPSSALSGANIQFVSSFIASSGATLKIGTSAGDNLSLNSSDGGSVIVGFAGNDDIEAIGSGEVAILSGDGNDLIFSAAGGLLDGGAGNDEITIST